MYRFCPTDITHSFCGVKNPLQYSVQKEPCLEPWKKINDIFTNWLLLKCSEAEKIFVLKVVFKNLRKGTYMGDEGFISLQTNDNKHNFRN